MTTLFWILSAAMTLLAVLLLAVPLLRSRRQEAVDRRRFNVEVYRDRIAELEQEHSGGGLSDAELAASKAELERELLSDVDEGPGTAAQRRGPSGLGAGTAVAVALLVPGLAVMLYLQLGEPRSFSLAGGGTVAGLPAGQPSQGGPGGQAMPSIDEMAETLAARLAENPEDAEGWMMLGRTYQVMERFPAARDAFARAVELVPDNPDLLARYAESVALARQGRLAGEPVEVLERVLDMDPGNPTGLWLMGMAARQQGALEASLAYWEQLRPQLSGEEAATLDELMAETRAALGNAPRPEPADGAELAATGPQPAATALPEEATGAGQAAEGARAALDVRVDLDPQMRDAVSPDDVVFIFARAAEGPRMPLAIVRTTVSDLPAEVTLDDSMAMTPAMSLSAFPQVTVGARVSKTGNAIPQAGDLEGLSDAVAPDHPGRVQVTIDRRI